MVGSPFLLSIHLSSGPHIYPSFITNRKYKNCNYYYNQFNSSYTGFVSYSNRVFSFSGLSWSRTLLSYWKLSRWRNFTHVLPPSAQVLFRRGVTTITSYVQNSYRVSYSYYIALHFCGLLGYGINFESHCMLKNYMTQLKRLLDHKLNT